MRVVELWIGLDRHVGAVFMNSVVGMVDYGGASAILWFYGRPYNTIIQAMSCR